MRACLRSQDRHKACFLAHSCSPVSVAQAALLPRALWQFGNVIKCAVSTNNPFKYNDYGCWCGFGGSGTPVDQVDSCCKAHDMCYRESRSIAECRPLVDSPYITVYDYTCTNKQVTCDSECPFSPPPAQGFIQTLPSPLQAALITHIHVEWISRDRIVHHWSRTRQGV
ncbi:phospholipase A2-like isoform X1 [Huso huso]|uniref:Phospholipase A2 n=1 Tax=Huso huso TaxID=61971 RepID=A0ABR0YUW6_HUSHU